MDKVDLHIHSYYSDDGQFSPLELFALARENATTILAIADHNNVNSLAEAIPLALDYGLTLIPAIEIDCCCDTTVLHLLGYNIDYRDEAFTLLDKKSKAEDLKNSEQRLQLVEALGIVVNRKKLEALCPSGIFIGEAMAEVALEDPSNNDCELLQAYRPGGSRSINPYVNFYWDFLSQGKPAYVKNDIPTLAEAIAIIQNSKGITVLAHPGINVKEDTALLDKIRAAGVAGIEVFSSYHDNRQTQFYLDYAQQHNLLLSCGSDFHGKTKPAIKIGSTDNPLVQESLIPTLLQK